MASKLVGVRLPEPIYDRLQSLKGALHADGDAEAIRALIEEFPLPPSAMAVFSAPIRSKPRRRRARASTKDVDEVVYGE